MSNKVIVGIAGSAGSGKDLVADMLHYLAKTGITWASYRDFVSIREDIKYHANRPIHFADNLKECIKTIFDIPMQYLEDGGDKNTLLYNVNDMCIQKEPPYTIIPITDLIDKNIKDVVANMVNPCVTLRTLMQYVGTEMFRKTIGEDVFVKPTINKATFNLLSYNISIISDVRFDNEVKAIKRTNMRTINGTVIRPVIIKVVGNDSNKSIEEDNKKHISENEINEYTYLLENKGKEILLFYNVLELYKKIMNL